jgi:hypothetical protein
MKRLSSILAIGTASLFSTTAAAMDNDATVSLAAWEQPLNNIAQVACHNCYEPQYSPNGRAFSAVLDYVKTVEIDFWDQRDMASGGAPAQRWFVWHDGATQRTSGNENSCTGNATGANDLRACLTDVKNWSRAHPGHFPLIVILDKKQDWSDEAMGLAGAIFVSPPTDSASEVTGLPHGISEANAQLVVMHNMNAAHRAVSAAVYQHHFIGRVWGNDKEDFTRQIANRTHLSAYYDYAAQSVGSYRILPITPITLLDHASQ